MRGISLPVETTTVVVLAAIVLVALLMFFSGTFVPGSERIKMEQQKVDLCTKFVALNSECKASVPDDLKNVCKKLGAEHVRVCCSAYCPKIETSTQCTAAGGTCDSASCSGTFTEIATCTDKPAEPHCCATKFT